MYPDRWPRNPKVFEINTWVWLSDLSAKIGAIVELGSVPEAEWDAIAAWGFDAVWLMGVWERSPAGLAIANQNPALLAEFRRTLSDFHPLDNVGSPYCIRRYVVDELLGGPTGLEMARRELAKRGMRLILDFVPNHVAPDHPWVAGHPEYFIRGNAADIAADSSAYAQAAGAVFACGRDPYFPAWPDVLQLNAFHPGLREAALTTIMDVAGQCDGVRCDMAMLLLNRIFERTWGNRAGARPRTEYWTDLIPAIKGLYPDFIFMAEAYWDLEWDLQQQGFDFCYDKRLYDRLEHSNAEDVRLHLCADSAYQAKLVRFLENHDEPRAAAIFSPAKERAAAVVIATLPGARLFHEGQFEGRKIKLPVFLGRRPTEFGDKALQNFYWQLMRAIDSPLFHDGQWALCERTGWPDNPSYQNIVAWSWVLEDERCLIIVNLSERAAQARVKVPAQGEQAQTWELNDDLSGASYQRAGDELCNSGLYVNLAPLNYHFFHCCRTRSEATATAASA